jgi:hypothetical protein
MWVFIRPGVVRSAKEQNVKRALKLCPIHPFDATYPFLNLLDALYALQRRRGVALQSARVLQCSG